MVLPFSGETELSKQPEIGTGTLGRHNIFEGGREVLELPVQLHPGAGGGQREEEEEGARENEVRRDRPRGL